MICTPRDIGTYFVQSSSRPAVKHIVDVNEMTCSCESFMEFKTADTTRLCKHLEAAIRLHVSATIPRAVCGSPLALLKSKPKTK